MPTAKVLVTGASGFIAKHCIAELLRNNFSVRGTLRDMGRADAVRTSIARAGADASGVEFVSADLLSDNGWQQAMQGCTYVLHVASPFPLQEPRNPEDLIRPAREGVLRVLKAATQAGIKRVVMTSSVVAITMPWPEAPQGHVFTEADWTNPKRPDITSYIVSKTLAERAAWDYVKSEPRAPELAAVNPAIVLGPATDTDISSSHEVIKLMAKGAYPAAPKVGFPVSDVRDVAATHVLAMTTPAAAGKRFLTASGFLRLIELGRLVADTLPDLKDEVPGRELPDWLVRLVALFDKRLQAVIPDLGHPRPVSNAQAQSVLGQTFRSAPEAGKSAALSLRELGVI
jgi:nucleoside-diphosphate-sugar epimerase